MGIAITLKEFLETEGVDYDLVKHEYSVNTTQAAQLAHISGEKVAKGVVLRDEHGYVLAVIPATHRVQFSLLRKRFQRYLTLAEETDLSNLFEDCTVGAIPPVGKAYDIEMVFDDRLNEIEDVYFEAGDHSDLVHVSGKDFRQLMGDVPHGEISQHT